MTVETAAEWRGSITEKVRGHDLRLSTHNKRLNAHEHRLDGHDVSIARLAVKVGIGAAVGALLGSGLVTFVVYLVLGFHR